MIDSLIFARALARLGPSALAARPRLGKRREADILESRCADSASSLPSADPCRTAGARAAALTIRAAEAARHDRRAAGQVRR
jgi:hypothetical protein